jgi:amino acid transporter
MSFTKFAQHIGSVLIAPRQTFVKLINGESGGLSDLLGLLLLQVLAVQMPRLLTAFLYMLKVSFLSGFTLLINTIAETIFLPAIAVIFGTLMLGYLLRHRRYRNDRYSDLAAISVMPAICLQLTASFSFGLLKIKPPQWMAIAILIIGGFWFLSLLIVSFQELKRIGAERTNES